MLTGYARCDGKIFQGVRASVQYKFSITPKRDHEFNQSKLTPLDIPKPSATAPTVWYVNTAQPEEPSLGMKIDQRQRGWPSPVGSHPRHQFSRPGSCRADRGNNFHRVSPISDRRFFLCRVRTLRLRFLVERRDVLRRRVRVNIALQVNEQAFGVRVSSWSVPMMWSTSSWGQVHTLAMDDGRYWAETGRSPWWVLICGTSLALERSAPTDHGIWATILTIARDLRCLDYAQRSLAVRSGER